MFVLIIDEQSIHQPTHLRLRSTWNTHTQKHEKRMRKTVIFMSGWNRLKYGAYAGCFREYTAAILSFTGLQNECSARIDQFYVFAMYYTQFVRVKYLFNRNVLQWRYSEGYTAPKWTLKTFADDMKKYWERFLPAFDVFAAPSRPTRCTRQWTRWLSWFAPTRIAYWAQQRRLQTKWHSNNGTILFFRPRGDVGVAAERQPELCNVIQDSVNSKQRAEEKGA